MGEIQGRHRGDSGETWQLLAQLVRFLPLPVEARALARGDPRVYLLVGELAHLDVRARVRVRVSEP